MKVNNTLKLLAAAALVAAVFPAQADEPRGRDWNQRSMPAPAVEAQPEFRRAPVTVNHPRFQERQRYERPVYTPPVMRQRPVEVARPVYTERAYTPPAVYAKARAPVYYPEPVATPASYPAYPEPRGPNVAGAVGGAVIGGVIGNVIGSHAGAGNASGITTAIGALIGGLIGSGL